jgi:hypothetical protein
MAPFLTRLLRALEGGVEQGSVSAVDFAAGLSVNVVDGVAEITAGAGAHPDLATHDALGIATDAELATHVGSADPHPAYALDTDVTAHVAAGDPHVVYALDADLANHEAAANPHAGYLTPAEGDAAYSPIGHTHPGGDGIPAGAIVLWSGLLANIPSGWALCDGTLGTPDLRSRFVKGTAAGVDPGGTGGAATHTHAAHAAHVVTQPSAHAAHVVTQPSDHASHTHTYTQVVNHVHRQQYNPTTTGALSGPTTAPDTSSSGTAAWGTVDTQNPTGGVATGTTAGPGATITHAGTAVDAHSAHAGTAVDAHSAHDSPNSEPAYFALAFIMKL